MSVDFAALLYAYLPGVYRDQDRTGELRHTFGVDPTTKRPFTLSDIDAAIEQLLSE